MALTLGSGPFSRQPAGRFSTPPRLPIAFWEPFAQRIRVMANGAIIVDSRQALAIPTTGSPMRIGVPAQDVRLTHLSPTGPREDPQLGRLSGFSASTAQAKAVLHEVTSAPAGLSNLDGHLLIDFAIADAWWLEDDVGYAHPRDPYHRVDVHRASRRVLVRAGDALIAETDQPALLFETSIRPRVYLPPDAVKPGVLRKSETVSACPYKGDGQHWHVELDGRQITDAGWSLTTPMGDALTIPRWISFYPDKVEVVVDGERLRLA